MRISLNLKELPFKNYLYASFLIGLATLLSALLAQRFLPPQIPLFYGQPEGEAQLAPSLALFLPGAFSLLLLAVNVGLSGLIKDAFIKKSLVIASLVVSIFAGIATLKIIFLVGGF